jgi:hypothetical protein
MPQGRLVVICREAEWTRSSGQRQGFTREGKHTESHQKLPGDGGDGHVCGDKKRPPGAGPGGRALPRNACLRPVELERGGGGGA